MAGDSHRLRDAAGPIRNRLDSGVKQETLAVIVKCIGSVATKQMILIEQRGVIERKDL